MNKVSDERLIRQVDCHCRDYFLNQGKEFKDVPWGTLAHSTHVRGIGTYENGVERCRVKEICHEVNLGYRDPASINPADYANREEEGVLYVPKAGEMLYHLKQRPPWAREMQERRAP